MPRLSSRPSVPFYPPSALETPLPRPVVGLDVSKASFAVCYPVGPPLKHLEVPNTKAGFRQLVKQGGAQCLFVLEATGTYHLRLA